VESIQLGIKVGLDSVKYERRLKDANSETHGKRSNRVHCLGFNLVGTTRLNAASLHRPLR
jgi:hypothetical protein